MELPLLTLKRYANFEGKLTCGLKKDLRNLTNFHRALESVKIGTLMGSFFRKQKSYDLKTCRGAMCHGNKE